jgi:hypothetical protein
MVKVLEDWEQSSSCQSALWLSKTIMTVLRPAALSRGGDERQIAFEPIAHASDPSFFLRMIFSKGQ